MFQSQSGGPRRHMWFRKSKQWQLDVDVVVIGTGGAGLTAALAAHAAGAKVAILEKSDRVGGTTAVSGGVVWIPNNRHMKDVGVDDSLADALAYTTRLADGRSDLALLRRFLEVGPE